MIFDSVVAPVPFAVNTAVNSVSVGVVDEFFRRYNPGAAAFVFAAGDQVILKLLRLLLPYQFGLASPIVELGLEIFTVGDHSIEELESSNGFGSSGVILPACGDCSPNVFINQTKYAAPVLVDYSIRMSGDFEISMVNAPTALNGFNLTGYVYAEVLHTYPMVAP